jgi:hypothetical protein
MKYLLCISLILLSIRAEAQMFTVKVTDYGGLDSSAILKNFIDLQVAELQSDINDELPNDTPGEMMKGMANSSVLAGKGIGSDYASYMDVFLVGVGLGLAADFEKPNDVESNYSGVGVAPGFVVGANLRKMGVGTFAGLDASRVNTYFNFMKLGITRDLEDNGGVNSEGRLDSLSLGLHFRYDWVPGNNNSNFRWGGLKLHWGYEFNQSNIVYEQDLDKSINVIDDVADLNGRLTGRPKYQIETQTHSIPLEISTDVRMFEFLSAYGGLGTDISYGKAKGSGILDGTVSPIVCTNSGLCGGGTVIQLQAQANLDAEGKVNPIMLRGFTGLQINIPYVRIFAQIDKVFGTELLGGTVGIRYVY